MQVDPCNNNPVLNSAFYFSAAATGGLVSQIHPFRGSLPFSGVIPVRLGVQFTVFEQLKHLINSYNASNHDHRSLNGLEILATATAGGLIAQTLTHPFSAASTQIPNTLQPSSSLSSSRFSLNRLCGGVWPSLPGALCRSLPTCAATAFTYEFASRLLSQKQPNNSSGNNKATKPHNQSNRNGQSNNQQYHHHNTNDSHHFDHNMF